MLRKATSNAFVEKKPIMCDFYENVMDRRIDMMADGQTDGQTDPHSKISYRDSRMVKLLNSSYNVRKREIEANFRLYCNETSSGD